MTNVSSWAVGVSFGCATGGTFDCDAVAPSACGLACLQPMCQYVSHTQSTLLLQFTDGFTAASEGWGLSDFKAQPVYNLNDVTTIDLTWFA